MEIHSLFGPLIKTPPDQDDCSTWKGFCRIPEFRGFRIARQDDDIQEAHRLKSLETWKLQEELEVDDNPAPFPWAGINQRIEELSALGYQHVGYYQIVDPNALNTTFTARNGIKFTFRLRIGLMIHRADQIYAVNWSRGTSTGTTLHRVFADGTRICVGIDRDEFGMGLFTQEYFDTKDPDAKPSMPRHLDEVPSGGVARVHFNAPKMSDLHDDLLQRCGSRIPVEATPEHFVSLFQNTYVLDRTNAIAKARAELAEALAGVGASEKRDDASLIKSAMTGPKKMRDKTVDLLRRRGIFPLVCASAMGRDLDEVPEGLESIDDPGLASAWNRFLARQQESCEQAKAAALKYSALYPSEAGPVSADNLSTRMKLLSVTVRTDPDRPDGEVVMHFGIDWEGEHGYHLRVDGDEIEQLDY